MRKLLLAIVLCLLSSGCYVREPAGPAERMGRGIDEITRAINEMNSQQPAQQPYDSRAGLRDPARDPDDDDDDGR